MEGSEHVRHHKNFSVALIFSILFFISAICAYAQETVTAEADKGSSDNSLREFFEKNVTASLEYKFFGHFRKVKQDNAQYVHELLMKFDAKYDFDKNTSIILTPILRTDTRHFTAGVIDRLQETEERKYHFNFKEGFLVTHGKNLDLYMGKKIYSWGKAEGLNPTDNINRYDFLDFPDREKIGVLSAAVEYSMGNYSVDIVFIPFFTPSRLPGQSNRWIGNIEGETTNFDNIIIPSDLSGEVHERDLPAKTLGNSQFAGRIKTTISGWDMALSYYRGFDSVPVVEEETIGSARHYTPKYNRISNYGLAIATTFDKLEVHAEGAYRDTAKGYDDDFLAYIIGGSYSWDDLGLEFIEKISLYFEFAGERITNAKDSRKRFSSTDYSRPLKRSVLGSLVFKFNEDVDLRIGGNYNIDEYDHYIQPKLTYKFSDKLKVKIGLDIMTGHKNTFWGKWRNNDRVFTNVLWYF